LLISLQSGAVVPSGEIDACFPRDPYQNTFAGLACLG